MGHKTTAGVMRVIKGGKNGVNYAEYDFSRLNGYKKKILMMFSRHFVLILLGNLLDCNLFFK